MTRGDKLLLIFVVLAASCSGIALWAHRHTPASAATVCHAVVSVNSQPVARFVLSSGRLLEEHTIRGPNGNAVLQTENGRIRMVSSPCRDKLCVKHGWISKPGESIICLPERIVVRIEGQGVVDAVTR
jgi:hypothetical protein